jgi:hypothetical protein
VLSGLVAPLARAAHYAAGVSCSGRSVQSIAGFLELVRKHHDQSILGVRGQRCHIVGIYLLQIDIAQTTV